MPSKSEFCKTELSVWIVWYTLISAQPGLTTLLGQLPDQTQSLHSLLLSLESQAQILLDKIGKSSANGSVPKSGKASSDKVTEKTTDDRLARYVLLSLYDFTRKIERHARKLFFISLISVSTLDISLRARTVRDFSRENKAGFS